MAGIKIGAHPMVVAVAMGLLGPSVLFDESDENEAAPTSTSPITEEAPEAPTAEEFARVENLWHEVRTNLG
jgi:hypothetical protein